MPAKHPKAKQPPTPSESDEEEIDSDEEDEEEEELDMVEELNNMTLPKRRKVYALKGLQREYRELRDKCRAEIAALEVQFATSVKPLFDARGEIVSGAREATEEEIKDGQARVTSGTVEEVDEEEEGGNKKKDGETGKKGVKVVAPEDEARKKVEEDAASRADGGIPGFWHTVLANHEVTEQMVMPRDIPALEKLTNVVLSHIDGEPQKGFHLDFHFAENEFFSDKVLRKTYTYVADSDETNLMDDAEGTEIHWTAPAKKLTVEIKQKKQRHKSGKGMRVVEREEKCESFFHFFNPPKVPDSDEEEEAPEDDQDLEELHQLLEMDFEAGEAFRDGIVPRAAYYYTGENVEAVAEQMMQGFAGLYGGGGGDSDDDDDDDDDDDEEEEVKPKGKRAGGKAPGGKQECKQQ